uniref:TF-B3 domain-containing protein n=2 Tax=Manihot esculenta TaxID=3983 RepID=A0A2C9UX33_MANES
MIKLMLPSHVSGGFWLGLNKQFCDEHMPKQDTMIVLENESGMNYQAKYLVKKVGLSGGWRGFSIAHELLEGDVLVFQLVRPTKFKVYIVRVNGLEEVDGALGLLKLDSCIKQRSPENLSTATEAIEYQETEPHLMCNPDLNNQKYVNMANGANYGHLSDHSENEREDLGFDVLDGIRLSESAVDFNQVKSFDDFDIIINGLVINPELSRHLQSKYYDLCCSQRSFLHEQLLGGLNCKLAAGVIAETINIADAIRASKLTNPLESFATWKRTLKAFQTLGMNINFLLDRLDQLTSLAAKSRRHKEARIERVNAEEELRTLETKLLEIKETSSRLDIEIQQLEAKSENYELKFREVAEAPW